MWRPERPETTGSGNDGDRGARGIGSYSPKVLVSFRIRHVATHYLRLKLVTFCLGRSWESCSMVTLRGTARWHMLLLFQLLATLVLTVDIDHQHFACRALGLMGTQGFLCPEWPCTPNTDQVVHCTTGRGWNDLMLLDWIWKLNTCQVVVRK